MSETPDTYPAPFVTMLPVADLIPTPDNPRTIHKDDDTVKSLAASIRIHGVLEPVLARPHPKKQFKYDLRAGARRLAATKLAGRVEIPVIVREMDDITAMVITVTENMEREDLTPMEESKGVQSLLDLGWSAKDVAAKLGKSPRFVVRRAALRGLIKVWREAPVDDLGYRSWPAAYWEAIAALPPEMQQDLWQSERDYLWEEVEKLSDLEETIARLTLQLSKAKFALTDAGLLPRVGACTACVKRTGAQPGLFDIDFGETDAEIKKKDRCLDSKCWENKDAALIRRKGAELKAKQGDVLFVTGRGGKELPADTVDPQTLARCKKADKGSMLCMWLDGSSAGSSFYARKAGKKDNLLSENSKTGSGVSTAPGKPTPLAARSKQLHLRREALVNGWLSKELGEMSYKNTGLKLEHLVRLAASFGTQRRWSYASHDGYYGRSVRGWPHFKKLKNSGAEEELWNLVRGTLVERLSFSGSLANMPVKEHSLLCDRFPQLAIVDKLTKAAWEIPEPKCWAKLNADGTPKGTPVKKAAKKKAKKTTAVKGKKKPAAKKAKAK